MNVTRNIRFTPHIRAPRLGPWAMQSLQWIRRHAARINNRVQTSPTKKSRAAKATVRSLGFSNFQLDQLETRRIESYLQPGERIAAAMHGHMPAVGGVLVAATNSRILFLYDIQSLSYFEFTTYGAVSDISVNRTGYLHSITIVTSSNTYQIDYINPLQADRFMTSVKTSMATSGAPKHTARQAAPM